MNPRAIIRPIPREPPVTTATLPRMENRSLTWASSRGVCGRSLRAVSVQETRFNILGEARPGCQGAAGLAGCGTTPQAAQKGPDARRRPTAAREAYFLYVERAAEGAVPPQMGLFQPSQAAQKGPDARRRPTAAREAYFLYVERAAEGAVPPQMGLFQRPASAWPRWPRCGGS